MTEPAENKVIVIGYGSSLRCDDAVGRLVVERIADLRLPNVVTISLTQLVPEIAEQIAGARAAIFVDATVDEGVCTVDVDELTNGQFASAASHTSAPAELLALASACYGRSPQAWLVTVPVENFEITEQVSPTARRNTASAVHAVQRIITDIHTGVLSG